MATHKSALKRHRQSVKRRTKNRAEKSDIRILTKKIVDASKSEAISLLKTLQSKIDKAGRKGVLHHINASHKVAQLMKIVAGKKAA